MLNLNSLKFRFKGFLIISLLFFGSRSIRKKLFVRKETEFFDIFFNVYKLKKVKWSFV